MRGAWLSGVVIAKSQEDLQVQETNSNIYIICPEPEHILARKIIKYSRLWRQDSSLAVGIWLISCSLSNAPYES